MDTSAPLDKGEIEFACKTFRQSIQNLIAKYEKQFIKKKREYYSSHDLVDSEEENNISDSDDGNDGHECSEESRLNRLFQRRIHQIKECTLHANHISRTLHAKRFSLKLALKALEKCSNELISIASQAVDGQVKSLQHGGIGSNGKNSRSDITKLIQRILQHWFGIYIRLRDGFVLLESGERRHPGDDNVPIVDRGKDGKKCKFPSQLTNQHHQNDRDNHGGSAGRGVYRSDGLTRKFSSRKGYTGYGWDEFFDEDLGIQNHLLNGLLELAGLCSSKTSFQSFLTNYASMSSHSLPRRYSKEKQQLIWGKVLDLGGETWDMQMDQHRTESEVMRKDFFSVSNRFVEGMNDCLDRFYHKSKNAGGGNKDRINADKLRDDKSERISWGLWEAKREGNVFCVRDRGGSLPVDISVDDWLDKFKFQLTSESGNDGNGRRENSSGNSQLEDTNNHNSQGRSKSQKKRLVIDDDSSSNDESENITKRRKKGQGTGNQNDMSATVSKGSKSRKNSSRSNNSSNGSGDGLLVQVREATDLTSKTPANDASDSLDAIKRQHGVSTMALQESFNQLDREQTHSRRVANEEEMLDGLEESGEGHNPGHEALAPMLHDSLMQWSSLQSHLRYNSEGARGSRVASLLSELLGEEDEEVNDAIEELKTLLDQWKERSREYHGDCNLIQKGRLDRISDKAYNTRDNFRESNMLLGNHLIEEIHPLLHARLKLLEQHLQKRWESSNMGILSSLSKTDMAFLRAAEEMFQIALKLVMEHESCHSSTVTSTKASNKSIETKIQQQFEKGQHLLLRGRSQANIGIALFRQYENNLRDFQIQTEMRDAATGRNGASALRHRDRYSQHQKVKMQQETKQLLEKALGKFRESLDSTTKLRHNSVALSALVAQSGRAGQTGHSQPSTAKWKQSSRIHHWQSLDLAALNNYFCGFGLWRSGKQNEAEKVLLQLDGGVEGRGEGGGCTISEIASLGRSLVGIDGGISEEDVVNVLRAEYWSAMKLIELAVRTLEIIPIRRNVENDSHSGGRRWPTGEDLLRMVQRAARRACEISDALHTFAGADDNNGEFSSRADIESQEKDIIDSWKKRKEQSQQRIHLSHVANNDRTHRNELGRSEKNISRGNAMSLQESATRPQQKIYLREDGSSLFRSKPTKKKKVDPKQRLEQKKLIDSAFHSAFGNSSSSTGESSQMSWNAMRTITDGSNSEEVLYREWGDERIEKEKLNTYPLCCPPLPPDMPPDIRKEYEAKYADILPKNMSTKEVEEIYKQRE